MSARLICYLTPFSAIAPFSETIPADDRAVCGIDQQWQDFSDRSHALVKQCRRGSPRIADLMIKSAPLAMSCSARRVPSKRRPKRDLRRDPSVHPIATVAEITGCTVWALRLRPTCTAGSTLPVQRSRRAFDLTAQIRRHPTAIEITRLRDHLDPTDPAHIHLPSIKRDIAGDLGKRLCRARVGP